MTGIIFSLSLLLPVLVISFVSGIQRDEGGNVNMNSLQEMIRNEISSGLQKQVKVYLDEMEETETQRSRSQFENLLDDIKETISIYDQSAKTSNAQTFGSFNRPAIITKDNGIRNLTTMVETLYKKEKNTKAQNCADLQVSGQKISGVYTIHPKGSSPLRVYCDLARFGGGWTVFQRRLNGSVDFYRNWLEYVNGFGDVDSEYWLGLRHLHRLTHADLMEVLIYLEDFEDNSRYARYNFFAVSSEYTDFRLDIGSYHGDAGDGMAHSRGHRFSTKDNDNDNHPDNNCATRFTGGWWYNSCYRANLNGQYQRNGPRPHQGITWNFWKGDSYSLKTAIMMFRPVGFTKN